MLRLIAKILLRLFVNYRIAGTIPRTPPEKLLIIGNHQSFLDPLFILAYCPFEITWVTHQQIAAQWHFRMLLRLVPHLVVDTASPHSLKQVLEVVNAGKPVCLFPEGRLTTTGALMKVYDGIAFLHTKSGAELLPVNFDGLVYSRLFTRHQPPFPQKWRPKARVTFFPLTRLPEPRGRTPKERRRNASDSLRRLLETNWFAAQEAKSLGEAFLEAVELYGRKWEMIEDIRFKPDTFGGVLRGALALGRLVGRLAAEGERVGVLMPNATPTVMLLFGMFGTRRVPAMLNYTAGVDGMQSACVTAQIKTIVTSRAFVEKAKLGEKVARLTGVRIVYLEDLRPQFTLADKLWLLLWAMRFPRRVFRRIDPEEAAVVLFTSGSEGKPKGVVLSHRAVLANVAQCRAVFEFSNKDKFLAALPLFHSMGLIVGAFVPLTCGARVFLYPSPLHYRMIPEMAYDRDCTIVFGTGTFLAKYGQYAHPYDFYSVRFVLCGAEKLPESVRQLWANKFGIRILEGYGVTEMSPVISINSPVSNRVGTVGKILPGIEYHLEPVEGIERGGQLHVRGPNLMSGYLRYEAPGKLEPPASSYREGWYDTGDVVEVDADGYVTILGRVKRFAKVAGEMVSLEVVELMATAASPQRAHAASAVASERRGEVVVLFTEDRQLRREQLQAAARERGLPEVAIPRVIVAMEKIPRLGSGKFDYVTLKQLAAERYRESVASNG
jgi:acyl-[acyl-carrier-protein]-phospholipid O-acyltransferase/long-chain-fatty-acid--[acyl-carrier-protein] ligase